MSVNKYYINYYKCPKCDNWWCFEGEAGVSYNCPNCGESNNPYKVEEMEVIE